MLIIAIILAILLIGSIISDGIHAYYKSKYIEILREQNDLLMKSYSAAQRVLKETSAVLTASYKK